MLGSRIVELLRSTPLDPVESEEEEPSSSSGSSGAAGGNGADPQQQQQREGQVLTAGQAAFRGSGAGAR